MSKRGRLGHTVEHRGARVIVTLVDGTSFVDRFIERAKHRRWILLKERGECRCRRYRMWPESREIEGLAMSGKPYKKGVFVKETESHAVVGFLAGCAVFVFLLLCGAVSRGAESVRDHGAIGDGVADDTRAIQVAANVAAAKLRASNAAGGSFHGTCPELYFPAGKYRITLPITLGSYQSVRGEDAEIIQSESTQSIFVFANCYRNRIEKMQFRGGSVQLSFSNANIDMTKLTVRDCNFQGWSDTAIKAEGTGPDLHMSATLVLTECVFDGGTILFTRCDSTSLNHCRHQFRGVNLVNGTPSIVNRWEIGTLNLHDFTATPAMPLDPATMLPVRCKWIDNYGYVSATGCRFGGESGGIPVLTHHGGPTLANPWMGRGITFTDCQVCCGPNLWSESALITLNGLPQCIRVESCRGITSNTVPLIRVLPGYDLDAAVASVTTNANPSLVMYSITLKGNQFFAPTPVPAALQQFVK